MSGSEPEDSRFESWRYNMTRIEFIEWFKTNTSFEKDNVFGDNSWREMVDYADYRFDYVYINKKTVEYRWEELYWGGSDLKEREFTFDEFIEAYKNDAIKY